MVSQPQWFCAFYLLCLMRLPGLRKREQNFSASLCKETMQIQGGRQKSTAGTIKNEHPCPFLIYEFFMRKTRFCVEPPTSLSEMIRWGLSVAARMPLVLSSSDVSVSPKPAIKSVHGCTLLMRQRSRCVVYFKRFLHFRTFALITLCSPEKPSYRSTIRLLQKRKCPHTCKRNLTRT